MPRFYHNKECWAKFQNVGLRVVGWFYVERLFKGKLTTKSNTSQGGKLENVYNYSDKGKNTLTNTK
jgi:hypothetical protein